MRAASTACGSTGASPCPQFPTATVVIPCITLDCARPSTSSVKSACEWMSTMPGVTTIPVTSITSRAPAGATSVPTAVIRAAVDRHVRPPRRATGAVHDGPAAQQQVRPQLAANSSGVGMFSGWGAGWVIRSELPNGSRSPQSMP